jgi:ABC-2 type transport system permease protein
MRAYLVLLRRELGSYFVSFIGYLVIALAIGEMGLCFFSLVRSLRNATTPMPLVELFFATQFFWLIFLTTAPVITMRLFSLEKDSGTFETLMTAPVTELQVVLAKFSAALVFYMVMWAPFAGCALIVRHFVNDPSAVDLPAMAGTFIGLFLLGGLFISFGCLASSLTKNQIVAAMISFAFGVSLFVVSLLADQFSAAGGLAAAVFQRIAVTDHLQEFSRGIVDSRQVVFYLGSTGLLLFLTHRVLESRRWK